MILLIEIRDISQNSEAWSVYHQQKYHLQFILSVLPHAQGYLPEQEVEESSLLRDTVSYQSYLALLASHSSDSQPGNAQERLEGV
jgi:hypothetical protein